jgi:hypothetical protein
VKRLNFFPRTHNFVRNFVGESPRLLLFSSLKNGSQNGSQKRSQKDSPKMNDNPKDSLYLPYVLSAFDTASLNLLAQAFF